MAERITVPPNSQAPRPSRLLSLPAELRLRIYEFVRGTIDTCYQVADKLDTVYHLRSDSGETGSGTALLRTCKQLNVEAEPIFKSYSTIMVGAGHDEFGEMMPELVRTQLNEPGWSTKSSELIWVIDIWRGWSHLKIYEDLAKEVNYYSSFKSLTIMLHLDATAPPTMTNFDALINTLQVMRFKGTIRITHMIGRLDDPDAEDVSEYRFDARCHELAIGLKAYVIYNSMCKYAGSIYIQDRDRLGRFG
jgi:hypothetical protein